MLSWLISTSLRMRAAVLALGVVLILLGYYTIRKAPLDVFPEFAPPRIEIQTEAPGLSTEEVESLVTMPLENALNGTPGVQTIRSKSVLGLSSILLLLGQGADLHKGRQYVQERVAAEAPRLPSVARPPVILQPLSSLSRVMKIGVSARGVGLPMQASVIASALGQAGGLTVPWQIGWLAETKQKSFPPLSQRDLTVLALWTIRPRLMAVPGVANVAIWGQRDRQFQVLVDPDKLRNHGLSLDTVLKATSDATVLDAGGFVDTPNQRLAVRHLPSVREPEDLARTVVDFRGGAPVRLGDVAEVVNRFAAAHRRCRDPQRGLR